MLTLEKFKEKINYNVFSFILNLRKEIKGYKANTKVIVGLTFHNNLFTVGVVPYYLNDDELDYFIMFDEYNSYDDAVSNLYTFIIEYCKTKPLT